jgi:hypothetical protein
MKAFATRIGQEYRSERPTVHGRSIQIIVFLIIRTFLKIREIILVVDLLQVSKVEEIKTL